EPTAVEAAGRCGHTEHLGRFEVVNHCGPRVLTRYVMALIYHDPCEWWQHVEPLGDGLHRSGLHLRVGHFVARRYQRMAYAEHAEGAADLVEQFLAVNQDQHTVLALGCHLRHARENHSLPGTSRRNQAHGASAAAVGSAHSGYHGFLVWSKRDHYPR